MVETTATTDAELVERLRAYGAKWDEPAASGAPVLEAADRISALSAEVERLTKERDEARGFRDECERQFQAQVETTVLEQDRALAAERQRDDLKAALEPFDDALGEDDEFPDSTPLTLKWGRSTAFMTLGDLRRIRTASRLSSEAVSKEESPAPTPPLSKREGAE